MSKVTPEVEGQIVLLRSSGKSYEVVGYLLGIDSTTARRHGEPGKLERLRKRSRERRRQRMMNPEYRVNRNRGQRERNRRNNIHTTINGISVNIKAKKRLRPEVCELCNKNSIHLCWHHWNNEYPEHGVWVCIPCHQGAEFLETKKAIRYVELKRKYSGQSLGR